jgi:hypothetical protein
MKAWLFVLTGGQIVCVLAIGCLWAWQVGYTDILVQLTTTTETIIETVRTHTETMRTHTESIKLLEQSIRRLAGMP